MKQLLIVTANQALTKTVDGSTVDALSPMQDPLADGAIGIIRENTPTAWQDFKTGQSANNPDIRSDFWLCHKTANQPMKVIEVDKESLQVTKQYPMAGSPWSYDVTIPTVEDGSTYTIVLVKKGTVPHERNTWTATETVFVGDTTTTANDVAAKLAKYFKDMNAFGGLNVSVTVSGATLTFTAAKNGDQWVIKCSDDLSSVQPSKNSDAAFAVGDVAHIKKLASECAANFGFTDVYRDGDTIYPGYPVDVPAGVYVIYTLRFATNRKASKTRDERASQLVHIAVNVGSSIQSGNDYSGASLAPTLARLDGWFSKVMTSSRGIVTEDVISGNSNTVAGEHQS